MAFHEVQFPTDISKGSSGGPSRLTDVVTLRSGYEQRNTIWADSRRTYDAGLGIRDIDRLYEVIEFFESRRGQLHGFRWKDWSDFRSKGPGTPVTSLDQFQVIVDLETLEFPLIKSYNSDFNPWIRRIEKPVLGTVKISIAGIELEEDIDFIVDYETGWVFLGVPLEGEIKAGFEFDIPARFNIDSISINVEIFQAGTLPQIDIIEIKISSEKDVAKRQDALYAWLQATDINFAVNTHWAETWGAI